MKDRTPVAVTSRSFSRHEILRAELLDRYERVTFNDAGVALAGDALVRFLSGHAKAITALEWLDDAVFAALPELKVVSKYGVGIDMLDLDAMARRGVSLGWTGGVNRRSVAELVVAFAITLLHNVPAALDEVRQGLWRQLTGRQLSGRTVGIIGCGHVGKDVAVLMRGFGCRVLAHDIVDCPAFCARHGVEWSTLDALLESSDVVTVHLPLDASTRGLLDHRRLERMKAGAILINTARGGIVDEAALKRLLLDGRLAGAAFDVFASEPPDDPALIALPNFLATPHIGGSTEEAILAMGRAAIAGLDSAADPRAVLRSARALQETW
jgi:D-3-phosphoglycerate dehydrogenase